MADQTPNNPVLACLSELISLQAPVTGLPSLSLLTKKACSLEHLLTWIFSLQTLPTLQVTAQMLQQNLPSVTLLPLCCSPCHSLSHNLFCFLHSSHHIWNPYMYLFVSRFLPLLTRRRLQEGRGLPVLSITAQPAPGGVAYHKHSNIFLNKWILKNDPTMSLYFWYH